MQTTTETNNTTTNKAVKTSAVHAILKHKSTGEIMTHTEMTRTGLAKHLKESCSEFEVLYVFKGKFLGIKKQTHFKLN